jgi:hypothetical protein
VAALLALALPTTAGAAVRVVNTTADLASDGVCSTAPNGCTIRDALVVATSADSVTLSAGLYQLNPALGPLILIGDKLNGAGARSTIIDGGGVQGTRVMTTSVDSQPPTPVAPQVSGVTIRRGNGATLNVSDPDFGDGGGVYAFGTLALVNSAVVNNTASGSGGGIGLASGAEMVMIASTVAANIATTGNGGGIFSANEAQFVQLVNSTISGNSAGSGNGGGLYGGGGSNYFLLNATVAGNQAAAVGGIQTGGAASFRNSILYGNGGTECVLDSVTANNSLAEDGTCGLSGNGNITGVNPGLGPLANNGGPTDTRAIGPASIAVNRGGAGCQATDQRGVARPQLGACDIGAYEYRAPRLTVIKHVVNDHGGTQAAGDFNVHVRTTADVAGSPAPGTDSGRTYVLTPGSYTVSEDADSRYARSFSGNCNPAGAVTLREGQVATCTITNNDKPPTAGKLVNATPKSGTVRIKLPKRKRFRRMTEGEQLPVGTIVDTLKGRITITAAANKSGGVAKADFYDGIFKIGQTKGRRPITVLTLVEKLTGCKTSSGKASAAAKKKKKRRLWGNGKGRFRTKGKHSAATVVGTKWLVEDRCTSTLTKVARGRVEVRDFVKRKTVVVKKGKRYIARAKKR